jgi:hypothetical protein
LNVHPATSAHGVVKGANHLLQHQTVLPTIASAVSLIFTHCPRMLVEHSILLSGSSLRNARVVASSPAEA